MPPEASSSPIVSAEASRQGARLSQLLAPERWPFDPALLPADTVLVGGAVRDALLGRLRQQPDLDLVVSGDAIALARSLARRIGGSCVVLDAERSMARLVLRGWTVDLARRIGTSLEDDLQRRDYTINAIALPLAAGSEPLDPTGGLADLAAGQLRAIREANLLEDPLRLLRGVRLAAELNFRLEPLTHSWIGRHHQRLAEVAGERVLAELERLAAAETGEAGLILAIRLGLLPVWGGAGEATCPWLASLTPGHALTRGLAAEESSWALPLARLATCLDGDAVRRLRGSRRLQQRCERLGHWRLRLQTCSQASGGSPSQSAGLPAFHPPGERSPGSLPRGALEYLAEAERLALQRQLEPDWPALVLLLDPADSGPLLRRWRDPADVLLHPRSPLDGGQLQAWLSLPAGPRLGRLIEHLSQERAFGRLPAALPTSPADALVGGRRWRTWQRNRASAPRRTDHVINFSVLRR
ncbi:MAG: CCA tRNA nucleotidyltransferase [Cyanobacteria bacterium]|nr:CCA tRNA nucleotidyltransferase [Cyanobacteriota bacterium]